MELLIVRHAIAEEPETWVPRDDDLRPLTDDGKKKMKEAAKGLQSLVPKLDVLASSPLTRAMQTAAILAKVYEKPEPLSVDSLAPGQHRSEERRVGKERRHGRRGRRTRRKGRHS